MNCGHPDPDLCSRLGRHLGPVMYKLYHSHKRVRDWLNREADAKAAIALVEVEDRAIGIITRPLRIPLDTCVHLGQILQYCTLPNSTGRHVHECDKHEVCTLVRVSKRVQSCEGCRDYLALAEDDATD